MSEYTEVAEITTAQRQSVPSDVPVAMHVALAALLGALLSMSGNFFSFSQDQNFLDPEAQLYFSLTMVAALTIPTAIVSYFLTSRALKTNSGVKAVVDGYKSVTGVTMSNFQALRFLQTNQSKRSGGGVLRITKAEGEVEKVVLT